jgi:hypothetical protein
MLHVALVPEFRRRRRTPQLDEGGVCAIAKFDQLRVDAGTLQDPYSLRQLGVSQDRLGQPDHAKRDQYD